MIEGDINTNKLRLLKRVVIGMGVLLVLGTAVLFAAIAYKIKHNDDDSHEISRHCKGGNFKISASGDLDGASIEDNRALLVFTKDKAKELVIFDYCKGKIVSRLHTAE